MKGVFIMLQKEYHISQCDRIVELIECYIIENNLKGHDKLPSERELCELWNCNRMTLRSALQRLEREGKVFSVHGSGNYVAEERLEIYLMDFKAFFSQLIEKGHIIKSKLISVKKIDSNKKLSQMLSIECGSPVYEITTLRYIDEVPSMLESSFIACKLYPNIQEQDLYKDTLYETLSSEYGLEYADGTVEISVTNAEPFESELLVVPINQPLLFINIKVCDENGTPIEFIKAVVRPDKIQFASKLK